MVFRLNTQKAVEAAAVLLRCTADRSMSYLRLLKLLYIADRECLRQKGYPITGDRYFAMDHGPVLSAVYDMIMDRHEHAPFWSNFFSKDHYKVALAQNPGVAYLSRFEVQTLQEAYTRYESLDDWEIVERVVHEFPEWKNNRPARNSSKLIPVRDLLAAVSRSDDADELQAELDEQNLLDKVFGPVAPAIPS